MKTIQQLCVEHLCDKTPQISQSTKQPGHSYAIVYDLLFKDYKWF